MVTRSGFRGCASGLGALLCQVQHSALYLHGSYNVVVANRDALRRRAIDQELSTLTVDGDGPASSALAKLNASREPGRRECQREVAVRQGAVNRLVFGLHIRCWFSLRDYFGHDENFPFALAHLNAGAA